MKNEKLQEYGYLRSEILQKIELHNTLLTFTITTTVAILTFALSEDRPILYLLPFCIIIPMSMRITYYRSAMSKLSAYMIVFLEADVDGLNWETRNAALFKNRSTQRGKLFKLLTTLRYYECLILSVICYSLYVFDLIRNSVINASVIAFALTPLLLVMWEIVITIRINLADREKQEWITKWIHIKEELINQDK